MIRDEKSADRLSLKIKQIVSLSGVILHNIIKLGKNFVNESIIMGAKGNLAFLTNGKAKGLLFDSSFIKRAVIFARLFNSWSGLFLVLSPTLLSAPELAP